MPTENLSAVLHGVNDLRLESTPTPSSPLPPGHVLLAIRSVGICGSDVHYWTHGAIGDFVLTSPMTLGHEASAEVVEVGEGVEGLAKGDRVAIEPGVPCRTCGHCKGGTYNLCAKMSFCATPPVNGSLTRRFVHPADFCFKIPDHVSYDGAALLEPLSVGVHATNRAGVKLGSTVLICGAGTIGLANLVTALAKGASAVAVTDIDDGRLAVAKSLGAAATVNVRGRSARDAADAVRAALPGGSAGADAVIECTGAEVALATAVYGAKSGGVVVVVGMGAPVMSVPLLDAACREVDVRGVFRYVNAYPTALAMVADGKVDVEKFVTHRFKLEDAVKAFETAKTGAGGAIKVIIDCSEE